MKDFDYYGEAEMPYPRKPDFATTYFYSKGALMLTVKPGEPFPSNRWTWTRETVLDNDSYMKAVTAYNVAIKAKHDEFTEDLFKELSIEDSPKKEKLFDIAWDNGHSYGFSQVYHEACDLVELIR